MKLKVGDMVMITKSEGEWNWVSDMDKWDGKVVEITAVWEDDCINFDGSGMWIWSFKDGHFTPVEDKRVKRSSSLFK